jgi:hypothetical protein
VTLREEPQERSLGSSLLEGAEAMKEGGDRAKTKLKRDTVVRSIVSLLTSKQT